MVVRIWFPPVTFTDSCLLAGCGCLGRKAYLPLVLRNHPAIRTTSLSHYTGSLVKSELKTWLGFRRQSIPSPCSEKKAFSKSNNFVSSDEFSNIIFTLLENTCRSYLMLRGTMDITSFTWFFKYIGRTQIYWHYGQLEDMIILRYENMLHNDPKHVNNFSEIYWSHQTSLIRRKIWNISCIKYWKNYEHI